MFRRDVSKIILVPVAANDSEPGLIIPMPVKPMAVSGDIYLSSREAVAEIAEIDENLKRDNFTPAQEAITIKRRAELEALADMTDEQRLAIIGSDKPDPSEAEFNALVKAWKPANPEVPLAAQKQDEDDN